VKILAVSGFTQHVGDQTGFWKIIDELEKLGATVTRKAWDELTEEDLDGSYDAVIVYSWGTASFFKKLKKLKHVGQLFIIAGVPRGIWQSIQVALAGGWNPPKEVELAICFQVSSIPSSYPLSSSAPNRVTYFVSGIGGNDHVNVQNFPFVHNTIVNQVKVAIDNGV
jgi:hypothetical protein